MQLIIDFLSTSVGPADEVFRFASISKRVGAAIQQLDGCLEKQLKDNHYKNVAISMLSTLNLKKYLVN